jgi:arylsulfatase A-like enzyme
MQIKQPAIALITCDELRRDSLSCYGNKAIRTPNIDSIAESGTRFDRCLTVSPWCLPARCSILTGKYPHKTGAYSNFRECRLDQNTANIFTALKKQGYQTALSGKCHFAPTPYDKAQENKTLPYNYGGLRDYYLSLGIDNLALQDDKQGSLWFYDDYSVELEREGYLSAYREHNSHPENRRVYNFPGPAEWHPDAWVGKKASEFIDSGDPGAPLFIWVSFSGPHYPFDAPEEYLARVDSQKMWPRISREGEFDCPGRIHHKSFHGGGGIDGCWAAEEFACKNYTEEYWERLRVNYNANMALIDDQVGIILASLYKKYGDDFIVIFTADHGEMLGNHGLWGKHNCGYREVWDIPMLLRVPGRKTGVSAESDSIVNLNDVFPTCLEFSGCEPADCDGVSLTKRAAEGAGLQYTFAEGEGYAAVYDGRFKYIHVQKRRQDSFGITEENYREFFDTEKDPLEFDNYISDLSYAADVSRLREKLIEHFLPSVLP